MKAIVTGAMGFVGKWLVKELLQAGYQVVVLANRKPDQAETSVNADRVRWILCPMDAYQSIGKSLSEEGRIDFFFHFAWAGTSGNRRGDERIQLQNIAWACDAIRLANELGCTKFIHAGSIMEYDAVNLLNGSEYIANRNHLYSIAKLTADLMCKTLAADMALSYINVIISNIYGPGDGSGRFVSSMVRKMLAHEDIALTQGTQPYDFIYAADAVKAILLAAQRGEANQSYYIGNTVQRPLRDFVLEMKKTLNSDSRLHFGAVTMKAQPLTYREFDTGRLEKDFGFKPEVSFPQGLNLLKQWILENEYAQ
ncbi:MAG: NAD-dependent epimerase/dehydratase family protein [Clostridiaceae bacterium]|nr:NAD-dependent epimerase/dehydratase family protein [Clostridiaceae bacterium]